MNPDIASQTDAEKGMSRNTLSLMDVVHNYYRWNLAVFPVEKGKRILDIGCGPALYASAIQELAPAMYCATDFSPVFLDQARTRLLKYPNCRVEQLDILSEGMPSFVDREKFDIVLCFDVLEHLSNDVQALTKIREIMEATGATKLLVRVPALPWLYGKADEAIGHYRRYSLGGLRKILMKAGFQVEKALHQNIVGIVPWFIIGRLRRRQLAVSLSEGRLFDLCVPMLKRIEAVLPPPVGLSVYGVGRLREKIPVGAKEDPL